MTETAHNTHRTVTQKGSTRTFTARELETEVRVVDKTVCADGVVTLHLQRDDGQSLPPFEPGAHVDLLVDGVAVRSTRFAATPGTATPGG